MRRCGILAAWLWCVASGPGCGPAAQPGLSAGADGRPMKAGQPFRGVGVNYFNAFARTLRDANDTSYNAGLAELARRKIPFARFMAGGFWPAEQRLYLRDRAEYFRRLDRVVRSAERHGVGLIPSLFWHTATVPDLVGEPVGAWGDPASRTHAFCRAYTRELVTRYRNSPAIWVWEFGNEYNLGADLPNAASHRPPVVPSLGTPTTRSARDELSRDAVRAAVAAFADEVRKHDKRRLITTGNAIPRPSAWHQRAERSWTKDTPAQAADVLLGDHPGPIDTISVHVYGEAGQRLAAAAAAARGARKVLFVGEFGVPGPPSEKTRAELAALLGRLDAANVDLAALWVYDFGTQDEWNVAPAGPRAWQLDAIEQLNRKWRRPASSAAATRP